MMDCRVKPGNDVGGNGGSDNWSMNRHTMNHAPIPSPPGDGNLVVAGGLLAMTKRKFDSNFKQQIHVHILAAGDARGLRFVSLKLEGAGNAGCALHPRSRVQKAKGKRTRAYRFSGGTPAFPAQWLYGLLRALPGESGFVVSVVCE
jgi:hypothetical protein